VGHSAPCYRTGCNKPLTKPPVPYKSGGLAVTSCVCCCRFVSLSGAPAEHLLAELRIPLHCALVRPYRSSVTLLYMDVSSNFSRKLLIVQNLVQGIKCRSYSGLESFKHLTEDSGKCAAYLTSQQGLPSATLDRQANELFCLTSFIDQSLLRSC
jgi:hypothetical protein